MFVEFFLFLVRDNFVQKCPKRGTCSFSICLIFSTLEFRSFLHHRLNGCLTMRNLDCFWTGFALPFLKRTFFLVWTQKSNLSFFLYLFSGYFETQMLSVINFTNLCRFQLLQKNGIILLGGTRLYQALEFQPAGMKCEDIVSEIQQLESSKQNFSLKKQEYVTKLNVLKYDFIFLQYTSLLSCVMLFHDFLIFNLLLELVDY